MTRTNLMLILLFWCACSYGQHTKPENMSFPFAFRENKGQITDQQGNPRTDIDFLLQTPGMSLTLGDAQLHYQFVKRADWHQADTISGGRRKVIPVSNKKAVVQGPKRYHTPAVQTYRLDVRLLNANKHAKIVKGQGREEQYHYYNPKTAAGGVTAVHAYETITYENIYPHIDWVLYTKGQELKYDFIVHPGGKVSDIKLKYEGADAVAIDKEGNLEISTPFSRITEQAPYAYEQGSKRKISASYILDGNMAGFKTGAWKGDLVIDPGVDWATYFGSEGDEMVTSSACDQNGNVYITGQTSSLSGIATTGAHQTTFGGGSVFMGVVPDAFLAKFDSLGQLKWATYYGGNNTILTLMAGGELATAVSCDAYGHVYIAGFTNAPNGIATPGSFQATLNTYNNNVFFPPDTLTWMGVNGYLAQFDSDGVRKWGTYYGASTTTCFFTALTCDRQGNVYVGGVTDSAVVSSNLVTPGAAQTSFGALPGLFSPVNGLLVKFDSSGNRIWGTYFGAGGELICAMASDTASNIYITGQSTSPGLGTPGTFIPVYSSITVADPGFLAKFNAGGQKQWCTYIDGMGYGLALDKFGHLYLSGVTESYFDSLISTPGSYMQQAVAQENDFLMQLNPQTGRRNWGTYYSGEQGNNTIFSNAVACDASGNVFLAGTTNSKGIGPGSIYRLATPGSHQDTLNAPPGLTNDTTYADLYLAQFDSSGTRKWGTYYGGSGKENAVSGGGYFNITGLSINNRGAIYLAGSTASLSNIATPGGHQTTFGGGGSDAFLVKFLPLDIALTSLVTPAEDTLCAGSIPFSVLVSNQGKMDKTDPLTIGYYYSGPVNGSHDTTFTTGLPAGAAVGYNIGTVNLNQPGSYNFTVYLRYTRDDDNKVNDTLRFHLFVIAPPVADINMYNIGSTYHFSNSNPQPSDSYQWSFGDGQTSTAAMPSHIYADEDAAYTVTLIVNNPCGTDTATVVIDGGGAPGTGIAGPSWSRSVAFYPNPANRYLHVDGDGAVKLQAYSIIDNLGQIVQQGRLDQKNTITVSGLAAGHYLISIQTDKGIINKQVLLTGK